MTRDDRVVGIRVDGKPAQLIPTQGLVGKQPCLEQFLRSIRANVPDAGVVGRMDALGKEIPGNGLLDEPRWNAGPCKPAVDALAGRASEIMGFTECQDHPWLREAALDLSAPRSNPPSGYPRGLSQDSCAFGALVLTVPFPTR